jgi:hypothetical protein
MAMLELFGANHGHQQINKEQQRDDADDYRFHFVLLKLLAKTHVQSAHDKERDHGPDENEVAHTASLTMSEIGATVLVKLRAKSVKKSLTPQRVISCI